MLRVVVGLIRNEKNEVLISQRHVNAHQGGLWEFPGGKLEPAESATNALIREFKEELSIDVLTSQPVLKITHRYDDLWVELDIHWVQTWSGEAKGMEGQAVCWQSIAALHTLNFPAANKNIISLLQLDHYYPIVDGRVGDEIEMIEQLQRLIKNGYTMIQWRIKGQGQISEATQRAAELCKKHNVKLFINTSIKTAQENNVDYVHLSETALFEQTTPFASDITVGVSCHNVEALKYAYQMGATFVLLSPVKKTKSHPEAKPLGWVEFEQMARQSHCPVYGLGGLQKDDLNCVRKNGGFGLAGIRGFIR